MLWGLDKGWEAKGKSGRIVFWQQIVLVVLVKGQKGRDESVGNFVLAADFVTGIG